jgi:hypothetical protein
MEKKKLFFLTSFIMISLILMTTDPRRFKREFNVKIIEDKLLAKVSIDCEIDSMTRLENKRHNN